MCRREIPNENADPLPKENYHLLKEKALREQLSEFNLATAGDRQALAARHRQYVL